MSQRVLIIGDSKSISSNSWPTTLTANLNTATSPNPWAQDNVSVGAQGASYFATNIAAILAAQSGNHTRVLFTIGVNDFGIATEAAWIADMETTLDAINARWPSALVYIAYPWKQGHDANATAYHGWIDTIIAAKSFARAGPDEATWLKGADNGATNTTDGIHYSTAGQAAAAAQWKTTLGY